MSFAVALVGLHFGHATIGPIEQGTRVGHSLARWGAGAGEADDIKVGTFWSRWIDSPSTPFLPGRGDIIGRYNEYVGFPFPILYTDFDVPVQGEGRYYDRLKWFEYAYVKEQRTSNEFRVPNMIRRASSPDFVPGQVFWMGLALNIFLYATAIHILITITALQIRCRRKKRGVCPWCRYPLVAAESGALKCPECGRHS